MLIKTDQKIMAKRGSLPESIIANLNVPKKIGVNLNLHFFFAIEALRYNMSVDLNSDIVDVNDIFNQIIDGFQPINWDGLRSDLC